MRLDSRADRRATLKPQVSGHRQFRNPTSVVGRDRRRLRPRALEATASAAPRAPGTLTALPRGSPTCTSGSRTARVAGSRCRDDERWRPRSDTASGMLIDRDLDAVATHLDPWILAAEPDHDPAPQRSRCWAHRSGWPPTRSRGTAVARYVIACLAERAPVVIAARPAAEIAAGHTAHLVALRQASHAISEGMFPRRPSSVRCSVRTRGPRPRGSSACQAGCHSVSLWVRSTRSSTSARTSTTGI